MHKPTIIKIKKINGLPKTILYFSKTGVCMMVCVNNIYVGPYIAVHLERWSYPVKKL